VALINQLAQAGIALSIVTCDEVYEGLQSAATPSQQSTVFTRLIAAVNVIAPTLEIARQYAIIRQDLRSRGQLIADNDLWIAATALERGLTLVTRDQYFSRVPGLKLYTATP
jgi:tRNA(fMet)-specific endonuclease VapC